MVLLPRTTCRICGGSKLNLVINIGKQYVSDFVDSPTENGKLCPIELVCCEDCTLVQQRYTAPQDFLYTKHYWYRSGVTETMRNALADVAHCAERFLNPRDTVLDIGSNDGTLLRSYKVDKLVRVGVEPAKNMVEEGSDGIELFINDFWSASRVEPTAPEPLWIGNGSACIAKRPKVITACGMFYDLEDPNQFIADVAKTLASDGLFIAQLMCLKQTLELRDVGNLSHEHLEFYTLTSLEILLHRHGLAIFDIEENSVNGGSYRLYIRHLNGTVQDTLEQRARVHHYTRLEEEYNREGSEPFDEFTRAIHQARYDCHSFIDEEVRKGKKVWVYGASTKGNVILQFYDLGPLHISGASDRSPEKWGKYTIGTRIKIFSEEEARKANPDYFLVLPYAFIDEFIQREEEWHSKGGRFLVPIPEFRIV